MLRNIGFRKDFYMSNNFDNRPIGVFDSGLGGLTSVRVLEKILPGEKIIYFGDTGRVPYGTRSGETIVRYSMDDLAFLIRKNVKAVLIACGTVSSIAMPTLAAMTDVPIVGVVTPACEKACEAAQSKGVGKMGNIAVLGTQATAKNGAYEAEIKRINPDFRVMTVACPMFVPLVENGYIADGNLITVEIAKEYIAKLSDFSPASLILGCTHYPIIRSNIERACREVLGYCPYIIDAGGCAAEAIKDKMTREESLSDESDGGSSFFVSDETQNFTEIASRFLGRSISDVTRIDITAQKPYEVLKVGGVR